MADDEDDFEQPTLPPRAGNTPRSWRMSDSERDRHRRWISGVPSVMPEPSDEVTAPLELLLNGQLDVDDYAQVEALRRSSDDIYVLLLNLARALSRHREKERSGSKEIEKQVVSAITEASRQMAAICDRITALESASKDADKDAANRLKTLEGDASFAKRAAQGVIVFLILSIGAGGIWLGVKQEKLENTIESVKALDGKVDRVIRWQAKDNSP